MADVSEEIKGTLKQGLGKLTGDNGLEFEGATQRAAGWARRKTRGALDEVKGTAKRAVGKVIGSPTLEAEGEATKLRGRVKRA